MHAPQSSSSLLAAAAALILLPCTLAAQAGPASASPSDAGTPAAGAAVRAPVPRAGELGLALRKLGTTKRVLMIAAHPDDENTSLLTALALGEGADVAYLSLTRGEGGQNGIGPEMEEALGLLRSGELLAARSLDGADQFFTRAYDFGYSRSAEETLLHWPRDSIVADAVRVIRAYRPDVVVSVFSGTPRDGHGHHQVAGIVAREAFRAAGEPGRFPEQLAEGLRPHAPAALYQSRWGRTEEPYTRVHTGEMDPLLGRSHHQVAMASRSRHRSQDMGSAQAPGAASVAIELMERWGGEGGAARAGDAAPAGGVAGASGGGARTPHASEPSLFESVDTTLVGRAATLRGRAGSDAGAWVEIGRLLAAYEGVVARARSEARLLDPGASVPALARAAALLDDAAALAPAMGAGAEELGFQLAAERRDLSRALVAAAGVNLEGVLDRSLLVPGHLFELTVRIWNGGADDVRLLDAGPALPAGWSAQVPRPSIRLAPGELSANSFRLRVPADASLSQPYFLELERTGGIYRWPEAHPARTLPFGPDPVRVAARLEIGGALVELDAPAEFLAVDKTIGEYRRAALVVPDVSVALEPEVALLALGGEGGGALTLEARVAADSPEPVAGTLRLEAPPGWRVEPAAVEVALAPGEARSVRFRLESGPGTPAGEHEARALFVGEDGRVRSDGYRLVDYEHIRPRAIFREARTRVVAEAVAAPREVLVGYIVGAGDPGPAALEQLGVRYELLGEAELARGELDRFDVIVAGIRAYEFRPDLIAHNDRLLDWARRGGTFIVQYNKYELVTGGFTPYPLAMARPHDRVTDPAAPVTILAPGHPAFHHPNRIGPADFDGWVQERGLYFASTWDERYTPLLSMADPGREPVEGSLLVAQVGEGTYVYTGLAFFRQLAAGVPGAYRLFANLIALGAEPR